MYLCFFEINLYVSLVTSVEDSTDVAATCHDVSLFHMPSIVVDELIMTSVERLATFFPPPQ